MLLKDFIPAPDVQQFVQLYRIVHLRFEAGQPIPPKAYPPRPEHCLAFYPFDTETVLFDQQGTMQQHLPVVLYGQLSEVTHRIIGHNFLVFQIIFYPGALYNLTGMPASEICNQYLPAQHFFSIDVLQVNEQLREADSYASMLDIANDFVRQLIRRQRRSLLPVDDACRWLLQQNGLVSVDALANAACLSSRQLERCFAERTGINPKTYERIIRFDKAFRLRNSKPQYSWLRIALESHFHDYQHLAKAYKTFTGLSPNAFHAIENNAPERQFGLSEGFYQNSLA